MNKLLFRNVKIPFLFIIAILLFVTVAYGKHKDSHKDLKKQDLCEQCHTKKPDTQPGKTSTGKHSAPIKDNVTKACTSCHEYGERSHPTDIDVSFDVPADLPLMENKVTCVTCHYPHANYESDRRYISTSLFGRLFSTEEKYKTYFLRRTNANGELCLACHK